MRHSHKPGKSLFKAVETAEEVSIQDSLTIVVHVDALNRSESNAKSDVQQYSDSAGLSILNASESLLNVFGRALNVIESREERFERATEVIELKMCSKLRCCCQLCNPLVF